MQFPCEVIVREVLPSFKAFIVKKLFHEHKFSQSKIADLLNITQASVSYYLHGERGRIGSDLIQKYDKVKNLLLSLTNEIATDSTKSEIIVNTICELCFTMHEEFGCRIEHKKEI